MKNRVLRIAGQGLVAAALAIPSFGAVVGMGVLSHPSAQPVIPGAIDGDDVFAKAGGISYGFGAPPIAPAGSLGPNAVLSFTLNVKNNGVADPGGLVYLASGYQSDSGYGGGISGDSTTVPGAQCAGITQLSTTPIPCTANAQGKVVLTYHVPAQPPAQGRADWIAENSPTARTVWAITHYVYSTVYRFTSSPIAPSGSLTAGATVPVTLSVEDGADVGIPNDTVYLSFTGAAGGGAASVGITPLTSSPQLFLTDGSGNLQITYTAPATLPVSGVDSVVVQDLATPLVVASDSYAFAAATPVISVGNVSVFEGDVDPAAAADFTVTLSAAQSSPVTVQYFTLCGIGDKGCGPHNENFKQILPTAPSVLTIPAGATSATINIPQFNYIGGHAGEAYLESWYVQLTQPSGAVLGRAVGEGLLLPDVEQTSNALAYLYLGSASVVPVANGANTPLYFTVTLGARVASAVTFNYATADGTAHAGVDYVAASGVGTIPAGATSVVIPVMVLPSAPPATGTSFTLTISGASGGLLISHAAGTGTILSS